MSDALAGELAPTREEIIAALDSAWTDLSGKIARLADPLSTQTDDGGWTVRQLLSHLIGAWQRIPVHAGFFAALPTGEAVPVHPNDAYWIPEWETAPLVSFALALEAAYRGARAIIELFPDTALANVLTSPFGPVDGANFLLISAGGHVREFHSAQFEAFITRQ